MNLCVAAALCQGCLALPDGAQTGPHVATAGAGFQPAVRQSIDLSAEQLLAVAVNGQTVPVRAGPGRSSLLHVRTSDAVRLFGAGAEQFARRGDWTGALRASERIGPVTVTGHRATAGIDFPFGRSIGAVEWFSREEPDNDAGQVGPFGIPATIVRFSLRPQRPGETVMQLPLDEEANGWGIASTSVFIGGRRLRFAIAPHFPVTVASAAAGGALAQAQGGRYLGPPEPVAISHGVTRPARPVRLTTPLRVGPFVLDQVLVRTLDYGTPRGVAEQEEGEGVPADILVTGRIDRQAPEFIVYIGADQLARCSSVTFDKAAMQIGLSCLSEPE